MSSNNPIFNKISTEHPEFNRIQVLTLTAFFEEHMIPESYTVNIDEENIWARLKNIICQPLNAPADMVEEMECDLVFHIMEADNVF